MASRGARELCATSSPIFAAPTSSIRLIGLIEPLFIYLYIYIYVYMCMCVYIYIYIYIYGWLSKLWSVLGTLNKGAVL